MILSKFGKSLEGLQAIEVVWETIANLPDFYGCAGQNLLQNSEQSTKSLVANQI